MYRAEMAEITSGSQSALPAYEDEQFEIVRNALAIPLSDDWLDQRNAQVIAAGHDHVVAVDLLPRRHIRAEGQIIGLTELADDVLSILLRLPEGRYAAKYIINTLVVHGRYKTLQSARTGFTSGLSVLSKVLLEGGSLVTVERDPSDLRGNCVQLLGGVVIQDLRDQEWMPVKSDVQQPEVRPVPRGRLYELRGWKADAGSLLRECRQRDPSQLEAMADMIEAYIIYGEEQPDGKPTGYVRPELESSMQIAALLLVFQRQNFSAESSLQDAEAEDNINSEGQDRKAIKGASAARLNDLAKKLYGGRSKKNKHKFKDETQGLPPEVAIFANCRGVDPELFFPERGASTREAKAVCKGCTIREECLEYALVNNEKMGIWGGLSERQRRIIKRQRKQAVRTG